MTPIIHKGRFAITKALERSSSVLFSCSLERYARALENDFQMRRGGKTWVKAWKHREPRERNQNWNPSPIPNPNRNSFRNSLN